jgi:hypothetical protein
MRPQALLLLALTASCGTPKDGGDGDAPPEDTDSGGGGDHGGGGGVTQANFVDRYLSAYCTVILNCSADTDPDFSSVADCVAREGGGAAAGLDVCTFDLDAAATYLGALADIAVSCDQQAFEDASRAFGRTVDCPTDTGDTDPR